MIDRSNGYEAAAEQFIRERETSRHIGASTVREWAATLKVGSVVLDLGCGTGIPVSQTLLRCGHTVYGIDASAKMISGFRNNLPGSTCEHNTVEASTFFDRTFDAAIAWGLIFLLEPDNQRKLIHRVSNSLSPGGNFAFTAPSEACVWNDLLTGRPSFGLGSYAYGSALNAGGFHLTGVTTDEGNNHYFFARKAF